MIDSEIALSDEDRKNSIQELRNLIKDDGNLTKFPYDDEEYLKRFLGGSNFNVQEAFNKIKTFYDLLLEFPEWFTTEPPIAKKNIIETQIRLALPATDKEGRPIYLLRMGNIDIKKVTLLDVVAVDDIWMESILMKHSTEKGLCLLIDIKNMPFRIIQWLTPHNLKVSLKKIGCMPFKDYRFHIVNESMLFNGALKIVWPFLSEQLKKMTKFHYGNTESLYEFVDPKFLPPEYGGSNDEIDYGQICEELLHKENEKIFNNFRLYRSKKMDN